jgi:hypothetical protein
MKGRDMTITNEALLALIVDDPIALRVMAAWGALALPLAKLGNDRVLIQLEEVSGATTAQLESAIPKLRASRVLIDGGITELGDRLLQQRVRAALDVAPRARNKK